MRLSQLRAVCASLLVAAPGGSGAQTIVDEWASVKAPPAPAHAEQYVAWHMTNAPAVSTNTTLTSLGLLKF